MKRNRSKKDALSRKSSKKCCVFSNMDHDNLWEVTIVPSQATSSNDTILLSTRTLSTISEQENKRDFSFDENKEENEKECGNDKRSKITSLSSTYQKLNHDISHSTFQSDKRLICALCENEKKLRDQINKKISEGNTCSHINPDLNNASSVPFIELEEVYKILDFIIDSDPKVSSLTNNCFNEILRVLRYLLAQHNDKKLEDFLLKDSSLYKCERCKVISYILGLHSAIEEFKGNRSKTRIKNSEIITAERDCNNKEKLKISINFSDLKDNEQSRISVDDSKVNCQAKYKDELSDIESLPVKKRAMRNYIRNPNRVNNISDTETDVSVKIKNKCHFNTIERLFTDLERTKKDKKYDYNSIVRNNNLGCEPSIKVYADIDKEEIVRKISYERKSQIDDMLAEDMSSKTAQKVHGSQPLFEKYDDIYSVVDTMKYLARGQFEILDKQKDEFLSKFRERYCTRLEDPRKGQSTILYSSRDDRPQRDSGFWLFDETGHLPEIVLDEYRYLPTRRMNGDRKNVDLSANSLRRSNMRERINNTNNCYNYIDKDSLEDCTSSEQRRQSDSMTFSSSSTENLMHEWIESLNKKYEINDIPADISRGRSLVSSRASVDIARHVKAQIANDKRSNNPKKSMREVQAHNSDIFAQLSPKIREKICHLIQKIVSFDSAKDSTFYQEKCLMTDALNNEKLQHSKSMNASFVHCNEITNDYANDCISTNLSKLLEDKNLFTRQDNFVNTCNQDLNNSKDSIKLPYENVAVSISSDKFGKIKLSDNNFTKNVTQHIIYKDASLKNIIDNGNEHTITADISTIYRNILENSKNMDWDSFRKLVEILHPGEKELWRDICKTINEEAKRIADSADDNTEVCIEISPSVNSGNTLKTGEVVKCAREIVFELDMTLKDVETFFNKACSAEKYLDTHKDADESTTMNWNNDEQKSISKQT